jgi:hypothetical protein
MAPFNLFFASWKASGLGTCTSRQTRVLVVDSVLELAFVLGAVEVAFRFRDESVIVDLPQFVAADTDAVSRARLLLRKETLTGTENLCSMEA